jgi:hypothetical protein
MARRQLAIVALLAAFLLGTLNAATMSTAMALGSLVVAGDVMAGGCDGCPPPPKVPDCVGSVCGAFFAAVLPVTELDLSFPTGPLRVFQTNAYRGLSPGPDPEPPRADDGL